MSFLADIFGLSSVGQKVVEVVAVIALVATTATGVVLHYEHKGATAELAKLQTSSAKLIAKANTDIATEVKQHAADVKANQEKTNEALAANTALQSRLADSVRGFDAYRSAHPDVPRPTGGPPAASTGECGARSCGDLASELAVRGNELAGSNGKLTAVLQSCQRDRDSLTGLPK